MRNIWKILFISLLCVILVCTAVFSVALTNFYNGGGVRFFGSAVKFTARKTCYFIDTKTKQILGQGEFLAHTYVVNGSPSGFFSIDAYPMTAEDMQHFGYRRHNTDLLLFSSDDVSFFADYLHKEWVRYYDVWVCIPDDPKQPSAIVIEIHENNKPMITAVCAESEEEVWENYEIYKECFRK